MKDPRLYSVSDYVLEFEAEGLKPLFQELMYKKYYPENSVMTYRDNILQSLIPKDVWQEMGESGLEALSDPTNHLFADAASNVKEQKEALSGLDLSRDFSKEDMVEIFDVFGSAAKSYGYFNVAYLELASAQADANQQIAENLQKIEQVKNKIKDDFNKIFFFENSYWSIFLGNISKQFGVGEELLEWHLKDELLALFDRALFSETDKKQREKAYVFYKEDFLQGDEALDFITAFRGDDKKTADKELRGTVANIAAGKVIARVKKINVNYEDFEETRKKMEEMKEGEILVSRTTDPSIIEACKKASAIITDVGGMLSHAAITSRELGIPCIVGTQNASKILQDGDKVEVDAGAGIVRRLS